MARPYSLDLRERVVPAVASGQSCRLIFDLYLELGSIRALQRELKRRDIRTRVRTLTTGKAVGGVHLTNGDVRPVLFGGAKAFF
jgi:hypothetical protein